MLVHQPGQFISRQLSRGLSKQSRSQAGFTLIELLVVVSISVVLLSTVSAFFMSFIVGSSKAIFEQKAKNDGEHAMERMSFIIRNARKINTGCTAGLTSLELENGDGGITVLGSDNGRIASTSSTTGKIYYLNSDFAALDPANTITFNCYEGENRQNYVEIYFKLKRGTGTTNDRETIIREFRSGVAVRNQKI